MPKIPTSATVRDWKREVVRAIAGCSPLWMEAIPWVKQAFELKTFPAKELRNTGQFGRLDLLVAAELTRQMNEIRKNPKAKAQDKHLACEVQRADMRRVRHDCLLTGREILRMIVAHVATREDHEQVYTYKDLLAVKVKGVGEAANRDLFPFL